MEGAVLQIPVVWDSLASHLELIMKAWFILFCVITTWKTVFSCKIYEVWPAARLISLTLLVTHA